MIIGKSLTALGGGGLKPEIIVTAKAGALLNLHYKDSSIILQSYQLGESETQHTFVVNVSDTAYVVEDVTNSASVEVLVDAVAVFSVYIKYKIILFENGVYNDALGGWSNRGWKPSPSYSSDEIISPSVSLNGSYMRVSFTSDGIDHGNYGAVESKNDVDLTNYTSLSINIKTASVSNVGSDSYCGYQIRFCVGDRTASGYNNDGATKAGAEIPVPKNGTLSNYTISLDVSSLTGSYDIFFTVFAYNGFNGRITEYADIEKMWAE